MNRSEHDTLRGGTPPSPPCAAGERFSPDLKAYLDHELPPLRRLAVARHLAGCAACREEIQAMSEIVTDLRKVGEAEETALSASLRQRLIETAALVPPREEPRPALRRAQPWLMFGSATVAAVVLFAVVFPRWEEMRPEMVRTEAPAAEGRKAPADEPAPLSVIAPASAPTAQRKSGAAAEAETDGAAPVLGRVPRPAAPAKAASPMRAAREPGESPRVSAEAQQRALKTNEVAAVTPRAAAPDVQALSPRKDEFGAATSSRAAEPATDLSAARSTERLMDAANRPIESEAGRRQEMARAGNAPGGAGAPGGVPAAPAPAAAPSGGAGAGGGFGAGGFGGPLFYGAPMSTTRLALDVDRLDASRARVDEIMKEVGGLVASEASRGLAAATDGETQGRTSELTLQVPAGQFNEVMDRLRALGDVTPETEAQFRNAATAAVAAQTAKSTRAPGGSAAAPPSEGGSRGAAAPAAAPARVGSGGAGPGGGSPPNPAAAEKEKKAEATPEFSRTKAAASLRTIWLTLREKKPEPAKPAEKAP